MKSEVGKFVKQVFVLDIGADVLDQTGQDTHSFGSLDMQPVHYELSLRQQSYRDMTRRVNQYLKEEYHAVHELLWLSGHHPSITIGKPAKYGPEMHHCHNCQMEIVLVKVPDIETALWLNVQSAIFH